jgi:hypothetical protein
MTYFVLDPDSSVLAFASSSFKRVKNAILSYLMATNSVNSLPGKSLDSYLFEHEFDIADFIVTRKKAAKLADPLLAHELVSYSVTVNKENEVVEILIEVSLYDGTGGTISIIL